MDVTGGSDVDDAEWKAVQRILPRATLDWPPSARHGLDLFKPMVKLYDKLITQALSTTVIKRTSFSNIESSSRMEPDCHLAALGAIRNSGMSARGIALTAPLSNSSSRRMLSSAQAS